MILNKKLASSGPNVWEKGRTIFKWVGDLSYFNLKGCIFITKYYQRQTIKPEWKIILLIILFSQIHAMKTIKYSNHRGAL